MRSALLLATAGFLVGGAWSVWQQARGSTSSRNRTAAVALAAALGVGGAMSATAGLLWMV